MPHPGGCHAILRGVGDHMIRSWTACPPGTAAYSTTAASAACLMHQSRPGARGHRNRHEHSPSGACVTQNHTLGAHQMGSEPGSALLCMHTTRASTHVAPRTCCLAHHLAQGKLGASLKQKHEAGRTAARIICRFQVPAFTTQYKTLKAGLQPLHVCNSAGPAFQQAVPRSDRSNSCPIC